MDAIMRTSAMIEKELETLRGKIRAMEKQRQEKQKVVEQAKKRRKSGAFAAHADGDKKAAEQLARAREAEIKATMELEDIEAGIIEGRARFEALEAEWHKALADEAWAELMAEAEQARKEAAEIDKHANAMAELLAAHGKRLEYLKNTAHNLGIERAFSTLGLRHFDRVFAWKMIVAGFVWEYEKPSQQYREASGYSEILNQQIQAAQAARDRAMKEQHEAETREGNGLDPEIRPADPEGEPTTAEAGATA